MTKEYRETIKSVDNWLQAKEASMSVKIKDSKFYVELSGACGKRGVGVGATIREAMTAASEAYEESRCQHYRARQTGFDSWYDSWGSYVSKTDFVCNDCGKTWYR